VEDAMRVLNGAGERQAHVIGAVAVEKR